MDELTRRKKREYQREWRDRQKGQRITQAAVRTEEQKLFPSMSLDTRPDDGTVCSVPGCNKVLIRYEIEWGKCMRHKHGDIITHREGPRKQTQPAKG